ENIGSRFWVELPFELAAESAAVEDGFAAAPATAADTPDAAANIISFGDPFLRHRARVRSVRVLVADDHAANRMLLQGLLQKAGHRVMTVDDGEAALDALAGGDFELALVDLHMPTLSGIDLLRQLRVMEAGARSRTPVLIVSADATRDSVQACMDAGARAFVTKPFSVSRLLDTIAGIVSGEGAAAVPEPPRQHVHASTEQVLDPSV